MKQLIALMISAGIALGSFAQSAKIRGNTNGITQSPAASTGKTTTVVVVPRTGYYSPYMYGYRPYGYPYGYNPLYGFGYGNNYAFAPRAVIAPSKLDLEIEQIRNDYRYDIINARHDKTMSKSQRREKVREIKRERDNAIIGAKQSYYSPHNGY